MEISLKILQEHLDGKKLKEYMVIPKLWNDNIGAPVEKTENGVQKVEKWSFYSKVISLILERKYEFNSISQSNIYCAMPRYTTAFDINGDGKIVQGTLFRMLILLPLLKNLRINVLYLLPITKYSTRNLKGDIGSPFAIKDFFKLDPNLHDDDLNGLKGLTLDDEFKLLVQACHQLGIKVVIDFIPRVTARNTDQILNHPDWFYWINKDDEKEFAPPTISGLDFFEECTERNLVSIYQSESTKKHLRKFTQSPDKLNLQLWNKIRKIAIDEGKEILDLIEEYFNITTPPAHSDWINDVQPVWTDITFWKLYMDNSPLVKDFINTDQPPYVMFDTIKANKFPGRVPNKGLWEMFREAISFYINTYDLDGFRFDIGHTLPPQLLQELFSITRSLKKHPIFISEDLFNRNHKAAAKTGYNVMLGSCWKEVSNITKESYEKFINELINLDLYAYACSETHDTPRIVTRAGGKDLARSLGLFNSFLPNGIPFFLTGYEVNEKLPLNCGLADDTNGAKLPKAFFNKLAINWTSEEASSMMNYLVDVMKFREENLEKIKPSNCHVIENEKRNLIIYGYKDEMIFLFNNDKNNSVVVHPSDINLNWTNIKIRFSSVDGLVNQKLSNNSLVLQPMSALCLLRN